jgi:hypothetical protein
MAKRDKRSNIFKDSTQNLRMNSRVNEALRDFQNQNQEHNVKKEALGPNTDR